MVVAAVVFVKKVKMPFDMSRFIEELQARPEIYNPAHEKYHTHRKERLKELGSIFDMSGVYCNVHGL